MRRGRKIICLDCGYEWYVPYDADGNWESNVMLMDDDDDDDHAGGPGPYVCMYCDSTNVEIIEDVIIPDDYNG
ncbi:Uncharacterised protein [Porphyromonas cangingivalis]|uniref:hypothetical protein n=1 Tax=Porphyromonas cangingivalis TaxID=36874 RepID=UPI00051CD60C|nr:hypothetical protein [Porphyromonas cangingivalis]KGL50218.1 hypothetical protein HQ34_00850 [Porphyromonas cangingivalis]SPY36001.1 Uncharacterised protein [Porphyromonas cangingivalis]